MWPVFVAVHSDVRQLRHLLAAPACVESGGKPEIKIVAVLDVGRQRMWYTSEKKTALTQFEEI